MESVVGTAESGSHSADGNLAAMPDRTAAGRPSDCACPLPGACWSANPLIVSEHVGNNPEIITEGQNGYVISYKNSKKAVNDIEQMICSSDEWKKNAGLFSLKVAQEKFNSERVVARVAKETLAIWENVK